MYLMQLCKSVSVGDVYVQTVMQFCVHCSYILQLRLCCRRVAHQERKYNT